MEKAVEKVYEKIRVPKTNPQIQSNNNFAPITKIRLPVRDGFEIIDMKNIIHCEADGNYTHFHLSNTSKKLTICKTIKYYANLLSQYGFTRINKSNLINIAYANEYKRTNGGFVRLSNGQKLPISAHYRDTFLGGLSGKCVG